MPVLDRNSSPVFLPSENRNKPNECTRKRIKNDGKRHCGCDRADSGELLADVAEALAAGGVDVMEVTFTVPNAVQVIQEVNRRIGDKILLGAGTIGYRNGSSSDSAGAEFIVSPSTDVEAKLCRRYDKVVTRGSYSHRSGDCLGSRGGHPQGLPC